MRSDQHCALTAGHRICRPELARAITIRWFRWCRLPYPGEQLPFLAQGLPLLFERGDLRYDVLEV